MILKDNCSPAVPLAELDRDLACARPLRAKRTATLRARTRHLQSRYSKKGNAALVDISTHMGTRNQVPLRTLDVHQIRRTVMGKRKAPGMKRNRVNLHHRCHNGQPTLDKPCIECTGPKETGCFESESKP